MGPRMRKALFYSIAGIATVSAVRRWRRARRRLDLYRATVVITGGSRGLGLVLARQLADRGARLALLARDKDELARAEQELRSTGADVLIVDCDVTNRDEVDRAIQQVVQRFGRIDVLINNAGVIQVGPIEHMSIDDFERAMNVHMWGPLHTMLAVVPKMREQGGGRIVNIASIGGRVAVPHLAPYNASKFALVGLSESMRSELKKNNIFISTVCPFLMRTGSPMHAEFKGHHEDEFTWFAISGSLPMLTMSADRAAQKIIEALKYGDPSPVVGFPARMLILLDALFPELLADALAGMDRLLPGRAREGDTSRTGWESRSRWAPSLLTRLSDRAAQENNEIPALAKKNGVN